MLLTDSKSEKQIHFSSINTLNNTKKKIIYNYSLDTKIILPNNIADRTKCSTTTLT